MPNQRGVQPAQEPPFQTSKLGRMCPRAHGSQPCSWDKLLPNALLAGGSGGWVPNHSMTNESHKEPEPHAGMEGTLIIQSFEFP